ncbi:hypothetical protein SAMN05661093_10504 [Kibdelosporangium aridum]|uniref:Peptidase inhibitor family I36 n=1 Tax=Kibdelosporangium aridum TaxID=2030 RepID=A0A1Y5Y817_KIBAR|nr:hypothetical protein SAMN05661093_10504 [Kibdelosporangium aridum]
MRQSLKRAAVTASVAAAALVMMPLAASAETCNGNTCRTSPDRRYEGGTLYVDFDVHGSGNAEYVVTSDGSVLCRANFDAQAPAQSRLCTSGGRHGYLEGFVSGPQGPSMIGLRW